MREIPAKTIVSKWSYTDAWFGCHYNMNIYKGCCHGCIYCDSRSECYGVEAFDEVRAKQNALDIIDHDLKSKRKAGVIGTGAMSDPYNPFEANQLLTRGALERIDRYGFGLNLMTKSDLVARDIDLFLRIAQHSPVCINVTVTTFDDALCEKIEPHVAVSSKRLAAVRAIAEAGLFCGVLLMPLLPFINDTEDNVAAIVGAAAKAGAKFVYPGFGVTLRQNQRDYFYEQLDTLFPGLKQRYIRTFGNAYSCTSPDAEKLWAVCKASCKQFGLLYEMSDIIAAYQHSYGQVSLF